MLWTGQDGGECCGKAIGEVNPSTLGKTTSFKINGCCCCCRGFAIGRPAAEFLHMISMYHHSIVFLFLLIGHCRICLTDEEVRCEGERMENLNLENEEVLEGVRKFRYLGDMLNEEGGSRLASISRVGCGWKKFRELSGILTRRWH